jgi:hypothetical protein
MSGAGVSAGFDFDGQRRESSLKEETYRQGEMACVKVWLEIVGGCKLGL